MTVAARPTFFWIFGAFGALCLSAFAVAGADIVRDGPFRKAFGWTTNWDGRSLHVRSVEKGGAAEGRLEAGDRVLAWNGDTRAPNVGPAPYRWSTRASEPYRLLIERSGHQRTVELRAPVVDDYGQLARIVAHFLVALAFIILGLFIGLMRPAEPAARWAGIACAACSLILLAFSIGAINGADSGRPWIIVFLYVSPLHVICVYEFAVRFPVMRVTRSAATLSIVLWILAIVGASANLWMGVMSLVLGEVEAAANRPDWTTLSDALRQPVFIAAASAALWMLLHRYRSLREPDLRRRINWVAYGAAIAAIPQILVSLLDYMDATPSRPGEWPPGQLAFLAIANLISVSIPISLAYAILRHRIFDIRFVLRRTIQYALAKNVLTGLFALPAIALGYTVISHPQMTIAEFMSISSPYLYIAVALGLTMRFRRTLRAHIDRQFFREAYDRERLLMELAGRIDRLDSLQEITVLVTRELDAAFHPSSVHLWFHQEGCTEGPTESASGDSLLNLRSDSPLVRHVEVEAEVHTLPFGNEKLDAEPDVQVLIRHGVMVIVPLIGTSGRLQGLMFLGEKKSEEPYGGQDRQLLQAIAKQIAVVRENQALKAHVQYEQRIRHEVLGRLDKQAVNLLQECPLCGTCYDRTVSHCDRDGTALTTPLPVERLLAGRYRLERVLGRGAMGAVYEASDLALKRAVAVKIMVARSFGDPAALRRFEREARVVASLSHPNVVAVYDYGALAADGAFIVMELVRGVTWRAQLSSHCRFQPRMLAGCLTQMCAGLTAAHNQEIIHRDLKPENVLIAADELQRVIKVVDFGVAKHVSDTASTTIGLTVQGAAVGTIGYMAPEQLAGQSIDQRVDVFATGVMAWEALVGERPFRGKTVEEMASSMSRPTPDLPLPGDAKELSRILRCAIASTAGDRYQTIPALQEELIPALTAYGQTLNGDGLSATDQTLPTKTLDRKTLE